MLTDLRDVLTSVPVRSIDDAVAVMTAIDARLPDADGLKWFNRLYLRVTESVRHAVGDASFHDRAFIATLDVIFANLYFEAVAAGERDVADAPGAWRPLLRARSHRLARIQFALSGMNAHINRDLPEGIVRAFRSLGGDPISDEARRSDFLAVDPILERVEAEVKADFSVGVVRIADEAAGRLDDVVAMWKVREARAAAWTNAQVLWALASAPALRNAFFTRLDGLTAFAGRGLLVQV